MTAGARRAAHRLAWSLIVVCVVVIGISGAGLVFSVHQAQVNNCQREVNQRFQQADISRAAAVKASGDAQIDLWNALLRLRGSRAQQLAQFTQAFNVYKNQLHRVTAVTYPKQTGTQLCSR